MNIFDVSNDRLDQMAGVMRPEHYVGFLLGAAFLALVRSPEPDSAAMQRLMERRTKFAESQRSDGEPDGMPVAPVYWTDEIHGYDDKEELIACMDGGTVFALHSSVEPHMQWVARMPAGEGEFETEIFRTKTEGEKALKDLQEETRREYGIMIAEVRRLYSVGDVDGAEKRMDGWSVDFSNHRDDPGHVTVDGERMRIGSPALQAAVEKVKQHLRYGEFEQADAICLVENVRYAWDSSNPHLAFVEDEPLDLFTFNVRNPNAAPLPERQVPRAYDHHPV